MTHVITMHLQEKIKTMIEAMKRLNNEAAATFNLYWDCDASTLVPALASDTTPATVQGKLTKAMYVSMITFSEEVTKLFGNVALSASDRLGVCNKVRYGSVAADAIVSEATEALGVRFVQLANDVITIGDMAKGISDTYNKTDIIAAVGAMSDSTIVFGADMSKAQLTAAINLATQYLNFLNSGTVTTGDYLATLHRWDQIAEVTA